MPAAREDQAEIATWMQGELATAKADLSNYLGSVAQERSRQQSELQRRISSRRRARQGGGAPADAAAAKGLG